MFLASQRRRMLRALPPQPGWEDTLRRTVPLRRLLPDEDRRELWGHMQVLLAEKRFEGAGGLVVTEAMRLTVAAWASFLLLHRETGYYPRLLSVVIYPGAFRVKTLRRGEDGTVTERVEERAGESWKEGTLVLAWDDVVADAEAWDDGFNVTLHEFAHQLDAEDGEMNGVPRLPFNLRREWSRVMLQEYRSLDRHALRRDDTFLDPYALESPAEFFAVATEYFFEVPRDLRQEHPDLYRILAAYYRQDPVSWPWP